MEASFVIFLSAVPSFKVHVHWMLLMQRKMRKQEGVDNNLNGSDFLKQIHLLDALFEKMPFNTLLSILVNLSEFTRTDL